MAAVCCFCKKNCGDRQLLVHSIHDEKVAICALCVGDASSALLKQISRTQDKNTLHYRYHWQARCQDGSVFSQFDESGKERSVAKVDWKNCVVVNLIPKIRLYPPVTLHIRPDQGEKGFKFWQISQNAGTGNLANHREVVGLQTIAKHHSAKFFTLLNADGSIETSGTDNV